MVRHTIQRQMVLDAVRFLKCHATAEQIYNEVCKDHPTISRTTVYRNLDSLAADGEIRKIDTPAGPALYDHITNEHYHIVCRKSRRVFDTDMDVIDGLQKRVKNTHGFEIEGYDIFFTGICPDCRDS